MTKTTGDRRDSQPLRTATVIPLNAALRPPVSRPERTDRGRSVVVPGPWKWFVHSDIPRTDEDGF
ncbi:hypothetical protein [Streptacidiphilus sp. EB129]|uniref:hypothetical protein n=1 Tax=Streptacidiphilus sp. EB129 TaxID=3156262 RepID=UPI003518DF0B